MNKGEQCKGKCVGFLKPAKQVASIKMGRLSTCMKITSKRKRKIMSMKIGKQLK